jgi:hypothetical protein
MEFVERTVISAPIIIIPVSLVLLLIVARGWASVAAGIFASAMFWAYNFDLGPANLLWVIVGTLIASAVNYRRMHPNRRILHRLSEYRYGLMLVLLLSAWLFAICWWAYPSQYSDQWTKNHIIYGAGFYVYILAFVFDLREIRMFSIALVCTSIISALVGILSLPNNVTTMMNDPGFKLRGLAANYLALAIPLSLSFVMAIPFLSMPRRRMERALILGAELILIACLVLSGARQSLIGLAIGVGIILARSVRYRIKGWKMLLCIISLSCFVGSYIVMNSDIINRFYRNAGQESWGGALDTRLTLMNSAMVSFEERPITGMGWQYISGDRNWAHNLFVDVLASMGIVGITILMLFLWISIRDAWGSWKGGRGPEIDIWRISLVGAFVYCIFQQSISGGLIGAYHLFWVSALISCMSRVCLRREKRRGNIGHFHWRHWLVAF